MLVSTNVLTPFSYAEVETPEIIPENEVENVVESGETPEKDNEITGEIPNSLWEVEWEWSLPLVREVVNESEPEGLKEEVEDSLDDVESPATEENKKEDPEKVEIDEVVSPVEENKEGEKQEENLEDNNEVTEQENVEAEIQGLQKTQEISTMDTATNSKDIVLEATSTAANQTLKINKYFTNAYTVDWWDGTTGNLTANTVHTYSIASGYTITLSLLWADRWTFKDWYEPLVPTDGTTMVWVKILFMPSLADWFGNSATTPGNYFFYNFNKNWALTSLPEWSFDTSKITTVGNSFFSCFNCRWKLTSLPIWSFKTDNITTAGNEFFSSFNSQWQLTSLPEWSFNTDKITTVGKHFFWWFNRYWKLTSLPAWSFDTSNITSVGDDFFQLFNSNWALTSLPAWSFKTNKITTVGNNFFESFNFDWKLISLPAWSFDTSNITTVGDSFFWWFNKDWALTSLPENSFNIWNIKASWRWNFFSDFNMDWALTSLPEWSFNTSNITTAGDSFFSDFNYRWKLTSLPEWSFNTSNISGTVGYSFFACFNSQWELTSLPAWSFDTSKITTAEYRFFEYFNSQWKLTSLPEWSFDISNIKKTQFNFFSSFNHYWKLTSLPTWSFKTDNITIAGNSFFQSFNSYWALESLPEWSFNISNIDSFDSQGTTVASWTDFFKSFNYNWHITNLPDSFKLNSVVYNKSNAYMRAFNSPNYTLNKNVSDLVSDITIPSNDRNTFSDNQPQRCGVHGNWLVTTSNACHIVYDANGWIWTTTWWYNSDATSVVAGLNITPPIKEWYFISWWYNISWERVETVRFPDMDNEILYAHWEECDSWYVVNSSWTSCILKEYNITYDLWWGYLEDEEWNQYEWNQIVTYTYNSTSNKYIANLTWVNVKNQDSIFIGWYTASDWWEKIENITSIDKSWETLYAHWEECDSWYVVNSSWTSCVLKEYNITYNLRWWYLEDESWNQYEWSQTVKYTYNSTGNKYIADLEREYVKRENSTFLGWYTIDWNVFDFWTISPENNTAYAKYECDLWYIENESWTACEKIRVEFNANGWKFSNNSDIYSIIKSKQVLWEKTGVLHTANLDDNDNYTNEFNWQQMNGYTTSIAPYTSWWITTYPIYSSSIVYFEEENVEKLDVSIKYWWSPYCTPPWYIIVWTWDHRQFDANYNPGNTGLAVLYIADFPNFWENREKSVEIEGDSFTIYQNSWCPSYWFFANISRTQIVDLIYEDNAFENIPEPTREWHSFKWWYLSDGSEFDTWNVSTWEVTYVYAKWECADGYENKWWECIKKSSWLSGWWGGWWGGGWSSKKTDEDTHSSAEDSQKNTQDDKNTENVIQSDPEHSEWGSEESSNTPVDSSADKSASEWQEILSPSDSSFTKEQKDAYTFAKENWITTKDTIQSAQMNGKLTRIAMAKMLSQYAINVLWKTPDTSKTIKFKDVTVKRDADYDNGVTLAYQLWIMWQNMPWNKFRPNDEVSRAEFVTALSRLLYSTSDGEYKSTSKYYIHHMEKLVSEWIITKADPGMKERRWYVMIMLMRSVK